MILTCYVTEICNSFFGLTIESQKWTYMELWNISRIRYMVVLFFSYDLASIFQISNISAAVPKSDEATKVPTILHSANFV